MKIVSKSQKEIEKLLKNKTARRVEKGIVAIKISMGCWHILSLSPITGTWSGILEVSDLRKVGG